MHWSSLMGSAAACFPESFGTSTRARDGVLLKTPAGETVRVKEMFHGKWEAGDPGRQRKDRPKAMRGPGPAAPAS